VGSSQRLTSSLKVISAPSETTSSVRAQLPMDWDPAAVLPDKIKRKLDCGQKCCNQNGQTTAVRVVRLRRPEDKPRSASRSVRYQRSRLALR
jgi:hypothetical protein